MSSIQEAIAAVRGFANDYELTRDRQRGVLGDGSGTVDIPSRPGYVYFRRREEASLTATSQPIAVKMARSDIPLFDGYPVVVGENDIVEGVQVLSRDIDYLESWFYKYFLRDHHDQHEFGNEDGGYDVVWVQKQQILPCLATPTNPSSTRVIVNSDWYPWLSGWKYFDTTTSAELSGYIPTGFPADARFVLLSINGATNSLQYTVGDLFPIYLPPDDIHDRIPAAPVGSVPVVAVYLPYGLITIEWVNLYDIRLINSPMGGSLTPGAHNLLDSTVHGDTITDDPSQGSLIVGTSAWEELTMGTIHEALMVNATADDIEWRRPEDEDVLSNRLGTPTYEDVRDWFNTTQSAGCLSGGGITDNGDGTIDVAAGNGYIKVSDGNLAETKFFDYPAAGPLTPTDNAKNWVYVDYDAGTPVAKITDDKNILNRNTMFTIARLYREGNTLHILEKGQCAYNLSMRTHRNLVEVFHYQRGTGLATAEKNARYLTVTAGEMYRGLNEFLTSAIDTSLTGTSFTYYYRDGGGGWTTGTASQIDNVNYDDGDGVLGTITPNQYGVFWIYVDFDSHLFVQYGQDSYKLAAAQDSLVPDPPDLLDGFAILVARVIVERDAANLQEISYPWEKIFMPQAATDHNQLGNLQGGSGPDEYYHLDLNAYEQLSAGGTGVLPNVAGSGYALVSTGVNTWGADLTPAWEGRHTFGDGITFSGGAGINSIVIPDGLVDAFDITNGVEFLRLNTDANYFLIDPALVPIDVGIGTLAPVGRVHVYGETGTTEIIVDCQGDTDDEQASLHLLTLGDGTKAISDGATKGWEITGRGNAWATAVDQNELVFSFWNGAAFHVAAQIDPAGLVSVFNGISFEGATGDNEIFVLDNVSVALELLDGDGLEYLRINSENANPYFLIDPAGAGIKVGIGIAVPVTLLHLHTAVGNSPEVRLTDADVAHGITDVFAAADWQTTDTLLHISPWGGAVGGTLMIATSDGDYSAFSQYGIVGDTTPTKAAILFSASKKGGAAEPVALADAEILFQLENAPGAGIGAGTKLFTVLGGGDTGIAVNPAYRFDVADDAAAGFVANFLNDGNNLNRLGIRIQCGADDASTAGRADPVYFYDGNGDYCGHIQCAAGTMSLVSVSDEDRKVNIDDTKIVGLDVIGQLKVRDYNWKADPKGPVKTGFIAQEALEVYPRMVSSIPNGELGTSPTVLIPVLTKAIQELDARLTVGGL